MNKNYTEYLKFLLNWVPHHIEKKKSENNQCKNAVQLKF